MRELPRGTVTLLFTDIEGSTRLLHELGDRYAEVLAEHRRVLRDTFGRHGGVEVDTQGDAFFYAFARPVDAVEAAANAQKVLASGPVRVRIGVHTGEPLVTDEGYVGVDVHRAARIMSAGHGGQVLLSSRTHAFLDGADVTDLGLHRLKDLGQPEKLFQLGDGNFPPLKTLDATNLPVASSPLLGRERELSELVSRLRNGTRLLTITGPGGAGKTRLALQAAADLVGSFSDGVFWVPLAPLEDPDLVLPTVAQTIGATGELDEHLRGKEMLLLLDNAEHLLLAAATVAALLSVAPKLCVLVTSRAPLRVAVEEEYPLGPLAASDAVTLFLERARAGGRELTTHETIDAICLRLDGLPLAIELAAARTKILDTESLLSRLDDALPLLTGGPRDAPERQRTLRATIAWSYDLLDEEVKHLFARLSVFAGSFSLEAAEAVCGADLDTVTALVEISLLKPLGASRFLMLETIHEYAEEKLEATAEVDMLQRKHATFFTDLSGNGVADFSDARGEWSDRLEKDRDNLRAAMASSLAKGRVELALQLAIAYGFLCTSRGPMTEGRTWLEKALLQSDGAPRALRQRALRGAANLAERQGDIEAARAQAAESLELARRMRDPAAVGAALLSLGIIEGDANNPDLSEKLQREALSVFEVSGNEREARQTLGMLGFLYMSQGAYADARDVCEKALRLSREAADKRGIGVAASNLGHICARGGAVAEALQLQREALLIAHELVDIHGVAEILLDVAALAITGRAFETAATLLGAVGAIADATEFALVPIEVEWREDMLNQLRGELDADALDRASAEGSQMAVDDLVAYTAEFIDSSL